MHTYIHKSNNKNNTVCKQFQKSSSENDAYNIHLYRIYIHVRVCMSHIKDASGGTIQLFN